MTFDYLAWTAPLGGDLTIARRGDELRATLETDDGTRIEGDPLASVYAVVADLGRGAHSIRAGQVMAEDFPDALARLRRRLPLSAVFLRRSGRALRPGLPEARRAFELVRRDAPWGFWIPAFSASRPVTQLRFGPDGSVRFLR